MDDFGSSSFFDYQSTSQSSVTSGIDLIGSSIETSVKQETFESSVWIQGFPDLGGSSLQNGSFQPLKNDFIESLISDSDISHTPSPVTDPLDPLDMIFNPVTTEIAMTTSQTSVKLDPDEALLHALNAASSQPVSQNLDVKNSNGQIGNLAIQQEQAELTVETSKPEADHQNGNSEDDNKQVKEIDPEKDLNLMITNVVTSFRVRCHLNLRKIAQEGINVIYQKESKKIVMRVRNPSCTAYIWSSGKVICTGANSETNARKASRKFARRLQSIGFQVRFSNYKVINVLAVCKMPYHINIIDFSHYYKSKFLSYEPEIHPAVTYRMPEFRVTFKIFSTGSVTLTCPVIARIPEAIKKVYPMIVDFFKLDKPNVTAANLLIDSDNESEKGSSGIIQSAS